MLYEYQLAGLAPVYVWQCINKNKTLIAKEVKIVDDATRISKNVQECMPNSYINHIIK